MNESVFGIIHVGEDRVFLVDLDLGNMSVTNDAERVYECVQRDYPGKRVIYLDSMGKWDEICLNSSGYAIFVTYGGYEFWF